MAQLSDDGLAFGGPLMRIDELAPSIRDRVPALQAVERLTLADARGRVCAADVISTVAVPPFDNSATDGSAMRYSDLVATGKGRTVMAHKFQKDGAGVLTSLTQTSGLVDLDQDLTEIMPGMTVPFIPDDSLLAYSVDVIRPHAERCDRSAPGSGRDRRHRHS